MFLTDYEQRLIERAAKFENYLLALQTLDFDREEALSHIRRVQYWYPSMDQLEAARFVVCQAALCAEQIPVPVYNPAIAPPGISYEMRMALFWRSFLRSGGKPPMVLQMRRFVVQWRRFKWSLKNSLRLSRVTVRR